MQYQLNSVIREEENWGIICADNGSISSCNFGAIKVFKELSKRNLLFEEICEVCRVDPDDNDAVRSVQAWLEKMLQKQIIIEANDHQSDINGRFLSKPEYADKKIIQYGALSSPLVAIINMTNRCNQACSFCYVDPRYVSKRSRELSQEQLLLICDRLTEQRVMMINFLGGEPTARFEDILAAIDYINSINPMCHCSFATNGTYGGGINEEQARELAKRKNVTIRISIHGYQDDHDAIVGLPGAYVAAKQTIRNLVKFAPNTFPSVNVTMTKQLRTTYELLIEEMFELGVSAIEFAPLQYSGCAILSEHDVNISPEEDFEMMKKMKALRDKWLQTGKVVLYGGRYNPDTPMFRLNNKPVSCGIGDSIIIDTQGDCYYCHMTVGMREYCGGNILEKEISEIWNSEIHLMMLEKTQLPVPKCEGCEQLPNCGGGCRISAKLAYGDYIAGDPSCPKIRMGGM